MAAHPPLGTVTTLRVGEGPDGLTVEVIVTHDALAFALNDTSIRVTDQQMYDLLDGPREDLQAALVDGRERFQSGFKVFADGEPLELQLVQAPTLRSVDQWRLENPAERLPCTMEFIARAELPEGCSSIGMQAPGVFDQVVLEVDRPGHEPLYLPLEPGERSPDFKLDAASAAPAEHAALAPADRAAGPADEPAAQSPGAPAEAATSRDAGTLALRGFLQVIPRGLDHACLMLALALGCWKLGDVATQSAGFLIASGIALTAAALGVVRVPPEVLGPAIAATVAWVAIENLVVAEPHRWRAVAVSVFGLVHGLGLGRALLGAGLPAGGRAPGIASFALGAVGAMLVVLLGGLAAVGWWREKPWYRARVSAPVSGVIGAVSLFWLVHRLGVV